MALSESRRGGWSALLAYLLWGLFPLYFNRLAEVPAVEVLAHRIVWGAVFAIVMALAFRGFGPLIAVVLDRQRRWALVASASCITVNWGIFIWAVGNGHALDASVGYFMNPLFSVVLGAVFLKERLSLRQMVAVALVIAGVVVLATAKTGIPWIALILPVTFGLYGLIRKLVAVDALTGYSFETLVTMPPALIYLATRPDGGALFTGGIAITSLLVIAGPVTAVPLVLFGYGARRLKLATLGLMQYVNPTMQLITAVLLFGETFTQSHAVTFGLIWAGLLVYSVPLSRPRSWGHRDQ